jgi:methionyl-tRNA synthetase
LETNSNFSRPETQELIKIATSTANLVQEKITSLSPNLALGHIVDLLTATNQYLEALAPWKAAKSDLDLAGEALATACEILRISAVLLLPVMPQKMKFLLQFLGCEETLTTFESAKLWAQIKPGSTIQKGEILFPRIQ